MLRFLFSLLFVVCAASFAECQVITVPSEFSVLSALPSIPAYSQVVEAMKMATVEINNSTSAEQNWRLVVRHVESAQEDLSKFNATFTNLLSEEQSTVAVMGLASAYAVQTVSTVANRLHMPVITTSLSKRQAWSDPLFPNLLDSRPSNAQLPYMVKDLIQLFSWRKVCVVHSADFSASSALREFVKIVAPWYGLTVLSTVSVNVNGDGSVTSGTRRDMAALEESCRIFVVGVDSVNLLAVMRAANGLNLLKDGTAWIFVDMVSGPMLFSAELRRFMEGALIVRHSSAGGDESKLLEFADKLFKFNSSACPCPTVDCVSLDAAYAYDAMHALGVALRSWTRPSFSAQAIALHPNVSLPVLQNGHSLTQLLRATSLSGIQGPFSFTPSTKAEYNIFNVRGGRLLRVGRWTTQSYLNSFDPIVFTGGSEKIPEAKISVNGTLKVLVPMSAPFTYLLQDPPLQNEHFAGVAVDILSSISKLAGFNYTLTQWTRTWDEMVAVAGDVNNEYDLAIGSITVKKSRAEVCDFTQTIFLTGLKLLVRRPAEKEGGYWEFMKPFHWSVWLTLCGTILFSALVMLVLDPEGVDTGRTGNAYFDSLFFTANVFLFVHEADVILKKWARAFLIILQFSMLILLAAYTANMATFLSSQQTELELNSYPDIFRFTVASRGGTTNWDYAKSELGLRRLLNVTSGEDATDALRNERADAYLADSPHIENIASQQCDLIVVSNQVRRQAVSCVIWLDV